MMNMIERAQLSLVVSFSFFSFSSTTQARVHDRVRFDENETTLGLASILRNIERIAWDGMRCTEMSLDPVIAVIVVSRDPATHVNCLYQALVGFIFVSVGSMPSIPERA